MVLFYIYVNDIIYFKLRYIGDKCIFNVFLILKVIVSLYILNYFYFMKIWYFVIIFIV